MQLFFFAVSSFALHPGTMTPSPTEKLGSCARGLPSDPFAKIQRSPSQEFLPLQVPFPTNKLSNTFHLKTCIDLLKHMKDIFGAHGRQGESKANPGIQMVYPKPCKELHRRISPPSTRIGFEQVTGCQKLTTLQISQ